jgi:lysophospholipase L1-like esterase
MTMSSRLRLTISVVVASISLLSTALPAHASSLGLPNSMAAVGDSITRAFDATWCPFPYSDCTAYSWSTGTNASVNSQYLRILARNPKINGHAFNDAKTGAQMSALDGQLATAASQHIEYATVLMGANDICTSSISTMTSTSTFQSEVQKALADFFAADPRAHLYLSSLPNIFQLWSVLHGNLAAQAVWALFKICQSMLAASNTDAQRQQVVGREMADNQALAAACSAYARCRWDQYAGYNDAFPASDISTLDYFHPNVTGQQAIAAITWKASYWGV